VARPRVAWPSTTPSTRRHQPPRHPRPLEITFSITQSLSVYWPAPAYAYDPPGPAIARRGRLPNGFDAGDYTCDAAVRQHREAMVNYLKAAGTRRDSDVERAASPGLFREESTASHQGQRGVRQRPRIDAFRRRHRPYAYGSYPDIEGLVREQSNELDAKRREPRCTASSSSSRQGDVRALWLNAGLHAWDRGGESGFGLIPAYAFRRPTKT